MNAARLAGFERCLRPLLVRLPPALAVRLYSDGRRRFLSRFTAQVPRPATWADDTQVTLWDLTFRLPLGNAAGLFKDGRGYEVMAAQGAGFYLAGTTTGRPRSGNRRHGVAQPFAPYPRSGAASNWLGLPNEGHATVAGRLASVQRRPGCPLGASVAACPDENDHATKMERLIDGMRAYDEAHVDFIELNESCPNTEADEHGLDVLASRLETIQKRVLDRRRRRLPVIVKLSSDTALALVPTLIDLLSAHGFDGVNFGNTSIAYDRHRDAIAPAERALYDDFTRRFGGGVSGRPLRPDALALVAAAADHLRARPAPREFHVLATGGIERARDVRAALASGASLCQWYTGYFEAFGRHGHAVYQHVARDLVGDRS